MSDNWIYYPCQMGDFRAYILFDHGIRDMIDEVAGTHHLWSRIAFKRPRTDGLPDRDEFEELCAFEDDLTAMLAKHGGLYIGRVSVRGQRFFHIYTSDASEDSWSSRLQAVGDRHGYQVELVLKPDPDREGYWKHLYPGEDDWQVIRDLGVLEELRKSGDDGATSRKFDHWAYFPELAAAGKFADWARGDGYFEVKVTRKDDGQFCVRLAHNGTAELADITSHTIALARRARELAGSYDGWETPVCKEGSGS